ncbi:hypothetical protein AB6A40_001651 [Gnathostoma spinigerum]|uniref:Uncharacterized protein n=1 Tax=Gnathostoma spinigerum TaxID=75299 RepID=A0ABD6EE22_9BILA
MTEDSTTPCNVQCKTEPVMSLMLHNYKKIREKITKKDKSGGVRVIALDPKMMVFVSEQVVLMKIGYSFFTFKLIRSCSIGYLVWCENGNIVHSSHYF